MVDPSFQPGFRFSLVDGAVIVVGAIAAVVLWPREWWQGFIVAFVVGHFFLFCNVFRVARPLELAWSALFVLFAYCTVALGWPTWQVSIVGTLLVTVVVLTLELRKPSYHGIFWRWINPGLPQWWEKNRAKLG